LLRLSEIDVVSNDVYLTGVPHEQFTFLRQHAPVHRQLVPDPELEDQVWVVTRPAEIQRISEDADTYSSAYNITLRRLTACRSFTQPIYQLEGLRGGELRARMAQLIARHRGVARAATQAFATAEFALCVSMFFLQVWLAPHTDADPWSDLRSLWRPAQAWVGTLEYAAVVCFLEPFYVAAGFGMYLNRRVELEAWDIEQEFRRAFAR